MSSGYHFLNLLQLFFAMKLLRLKFSVLWSERVVIDLSLAERGIRMTVEVIVVGEELNLDSMDSVLFCSILHVYFLV